jgi:hypothetical protein
MPRRKSSKKSTKRRVHRGGFYGAAGAIAPGAMQWNRGSEMGDWAVSRRGNNAQFGMGRKRKRTRRGGNRYGNSYASFEGRGSRGLADVSTGTHKPENTAAFGKFNNYGAGPGQFDSFRGVGPKQ